MKVHINYWLKKGCLDISENSPGILIMKTNYLANIPLFDCICQISYYFSGKN